MNRKRLLGRRDDEEFDDIIDDIPIPANKNTAPPTAISKPEEIKEGSISKVYASKSIKKVTSTKMNEEEISEKVIPSDVKTIKILNGQAPVDEFVPNRASYRVYGAMGNQYSKTLVVSKTQTNNNKFYIVQLLENPNTKQYFTFYRWGRIGKAGSTKLNTFGTNVSHALMDYNDKINDKTHGGEYKEVDIVYSNEDDEEDADAKMQESIKTSKVESEVAELIKGLFSVKMFTEQVKEIGYDVKRMPLGKLSKAAIKSGFECLRALSDLFEANKGTANQVRGQKLAANKTLAKKIQTFSDEFYGHIPHDIGMSHMSNLLLSDAEKVEKKLDLLDMLSKFKSGKEGSKESKSTNMLDAHYERLGTQIKAMPNTSEEAKIIKKFAESAIAPNHISLKIKIQEVFSLKKDSEFDEFKRDSSKKLLLFHGAKMTSFASILSQGLQLPPHEAPNTGFQFGKGIYHLDVFSKAVLNCFAHLSNGVAFILVSEVAVGNQKEMFHPDYNANSLPPGFDSVKGCGRQGPVSQHEADFEGAGTKLQMGPLGNSQHPSSMLQFNEYVVYDKSQTRMRYLLKCSVGK